MKLGKRRKDDVPAAEPQAGADPVVPREHVTETWTAPLSGATSAPGYGEGVAIEPAVDSEAVELVGDAAPAPGPPVPPVATSIPEPPPTPRPVPPRAAPAEAPHVAPPVGGAAAAGSAAGFAATAADPLREELRVLSAERPEIVVGAAFAGGIVAAMILRRLGN
jgi:hypothetical protein